MKRKFNQKCHECLSCAFNQENEEGTGICNYSGYSFDPNLPEAEKCFNYLTTEQWESIQSNKTESTKSEMWKTVSAGNNHDWRDNHCCRDCAFFPLNENVNATDKGKREWINSYRCPGFAEDNSNGCIDHMTFSQYRILISSSPAQRIALFEQNNDDNREKNN